MVFTATPPSASAAASAVPPWTLDSLRAWGAALTQLVARRAAREAEIVATYHQEIRNENRQHEAAFQELTTAYDQERAELESSLNQQQATLVRCWDDVNEDRETEFAARQRELTQWFEEQRAAAFKQRQDAEWLVGSVLDDNSADSPLQSLIRFRAMLTNGAAEMQSAVMAAEQWRDGALAYLARCRMSTEPQPIEPPEPVDMLEPLMERCLEAARTAEQPYQRIQRMWLPRLFAGFTPLLVFVLLAGGLGGGAWLGITPEQLGIKGERIDLEWLGILAVASGAIALVAMFILHMLANSRTSDPLSVLFAKVRTAQAALARWQKLSRAELEAAEYDLFRRQESRNRQREEGLKQAEQRFEITMAEITQRFQIEHPQLLRHVQSARQQHRRQQEDELQRGTMQSQSARQEFAARRARDFAAFAQVHAQRLVEFEHQRNQSFADLQREWTTELVQLTEQAQAWNVAAELHNPRWEAWLAAPAESSDSESPQLMVGHWPVRLSKLPDGLPTSSMTTPASSWTLPLGWNLHEHAGLLLKTSGPQGRQAALSVLQAMMLRLLTTLPSGRVRFMIIDPVGLGEAFSAFMHLADVDELLVTQRIWTEPNAIEERLADLTQHIETVLQMFLRNEYATLEDYNRQAGEVAEPYRVLVVAGAPTQLTDIALRRLWSIVAGGPKCGVIPLIHVDVAQPLPRGFALADLGSPLLTLEWKGDGFATPQKELAAWPLTLDGPPAADLLTAVIKAAGRRAGDVRRVEVPFHRVAPDAAHVWTRSAARGVDIPIGRSGATKTQSVTLGSGTSQHVLVAGKTGSGKSTLLHALITNAALFYSPREVELYLIDFKKGVEFQVYARRQLPHARVIAIESDREFGVSVLQRLDELLQDRSATFREVGVPDLPSFRQARPAQPMPRVMLVIDEFQEFFVEDDPLSQTAALMLDRLIRQGRAFGVHVILGSQTLAGAYSLARSTLGQVAVRIALQCSETDAHLILSEENTAARMLTRPGEAIYNDANGLSAGNHLFQVVWLEDQSRDQYLEQVRQRAVIDQLVPPPAIVFEGNVPADIGRLPETNGHLSPSGAASVWLGEAVSLRGALSLDFTPAVGFNLLLVGQDEASALGVLTACALSLTKSKDALSSPPATERPGASGKDAEDPTFATIEFEHTIWLFNGSPNDRSIAVWNELAAARPAVQAFDIPVLDGKLEELVEEIRRRDGRPGPRIWLCLFDLVRFRKLRKKDDDFGSFGGFDKKSAASPSEMFAEVLRDGPSVGVHTWVWSDSVNTMSRWLSREMQGHFEQRIAFAMNAADSSQLLDTPAASRLGPNRAWLFRGDRGVLEKFRPFSPPQPSQPPGRRP